MFILSLTLPTALTVWVAEQREVEKVKKNTILSEHAALSCQSQRRLKGRERKCHT